ncbi:MAG: gliding motility-associated C-terminal domain-containing protein [Brumimicrobium sp.]|nr:gliding motility-associated C-terminal domain-containing protein [Brumimicrobium sp.]
MKLNKKLLHSALIFIPFGLSAQVMHSNGMIIHVTNGGILHCNGGVLLSNTDFTNDGLVDITKNSTLAQPGTLEFNMNSNVAGDGTYRIEQDWINDANFSSGNSEVILYGSTEQFITSNTGVVTTFNDLTLTGIGTSDNRRKTLLDVDSKTGTNGVLNLNDRELYTQGNIFTVENSSPNAVLNSLTYNEEGFVSSIDAGNLIRNINQSDDYIFPVGSSDGTRRYRPVVVGSYSTNPQSYAVRMNNFTPSQNGYAVGNHESHIDDVNSKYYHSIAQLSGVNDADLSIAYDGNTEKKWESIAHWGVASNKWEDTYNNSISTLGNYKLVSKSNWNFPVNENEYALITKSKTVTIVESFSPNGDGSNDFFHIDNLEEYPKTEIWIYTRWGLEVYHNEDYKNDWDGTSQNALNIGSEILPEGTYYYIVKMGGDKELSNSGKEYKGFVYIKR